LQTKTDGRGVTCTYSYDDRLRIVTNAYTGALPEQNLTTVWQYDARNLVKSITEQFASTNTGPATMIQRSYDPYSQLSSESVGGGSYGFSASQNWDAAGRRTLLSLSGGTYGFGWQADGSLTSASDPTGSGVYTYNTAGLLTSRAVGNRYTAINSRDGEGRPTSISTTVNMVNALTESMSWSGDGLLSSQTLARTDFTDNHAYSYAPLSRRLVQEQLNLNAGTSWTNAMTYDNGVPAGPGVLTQIGQATGTGGKWSSSSDAFSRVANETNNSIQFAAYGHVNGQSTLDAWLDNQPVSITGIGTNAMQWRASMELTPGAHQLKVAANHPSGFYTAWATNSFTNNITYQAATDTYDPAGNITNRTWKSQSGTVDRTQTLSWDARGRLHSVVERDSSNSGYNWTAVYDALNRRIQTTTVLVSNGIASTVSPQSINQFYDPQVEFLELGLSTGNQTVWKLYGPDLNGRYGGLNGTGGFDGFSPYLNQFYPVVSDFRGNVLGEITNGIVSWSPSRPTGYGAVPGYRPAPFGNGVDISLASAWRGRWEDITGYYHVGMRDYDSVSGRWLTYDSVWNELDPNGYSFAGGEPIMGFDADGRLYFDVGTFFSGFGHDLYATGARLVNGVVQAGAIGSDMIGSSVAGGVDYAFGTDYQANYQGYSQLYQNIAANPSAGPTAGSILKGTANAELNIVTLGGASVVEGGYTAYQTGNYNQLQDSFAGIAVSGIAARTINNLAPNTYRGVAPTDSPQSPFTSGIDSPGDNMDLLSHAQGNTTTMYGSAPDSGYVSTSESFDVASQTYAGWGYGDSGPVYSVKSWRGVDVNETLGDTSPYPNDQEIAMPGGVYGSEIQGYYTSGNNFVSNPLFGLNGTYAGLVGLGSQTAYLSGPIGTKR
jgi:RHS repeat-associated protein